MKYMKYLAIIILMTGCATKELTNPLRRMGSVTPPPQKAPLKFLGRPAQVNFNYYCPVSGMDDFHRGIHAAGH